MTMLTHMQSPMRRSARPAEAHIPSRAQGAAHLGAIKRFFTGVLTALVATVAAAGAIALKGVYFLSHFSY
jgi:hypothetical protein